MSNSSTLPLVTVAVPSFNHGQYLDEALSSIFEQQLPLEVFVMDGGSTDDSIKVIKKWAPRLAGWRSHADAGQAAAINEGIAQGCAPYVCWLNSDDWFLPNGLSRLVEAMKNNKETPVVYGRAWNVDQKTGKKTPVWVEPFDEDRLALRCIVSQPATLIRRKAWETVGGLRDEMQMAMDYDLWWRLYKVAGKLEFIDEYIAINREHEKTKTNTYRKRHYKEAIKTVKEHYGRVPIKWWVAQPYSVWFKSLVNRRLRK